VNRKQAHINLYLNAKSNHRPPNKPPVLFTSAHRVKAICNQDSLQAEMDTQDRTFCENGYSIKWIHRLLTHARTKLDHPAISFLPFIQNTFNHNSKVLPRHYIKTVGLSLRKMASFHCPIKDDTRLKTSNVYAIPCKCGTVYNLKRMRSFVLIQLFHYIHQNTTIYTYYVYT
jgi:hypothetical protein